MSSHSLAARLVLAIVGAYKVLLAPLVGGVCRFTPSCSDYMTEAVSRHGALRGGLLGLRRLARCHPLGGHGWDPVPGDLRNEECKRENVEGEKRPPFSGWLSSVSILPLTFSILPFTLSILPSTFRRSPWRQAPRAGR
jgi:putative membrane protein insertion efficiency factor